MPRRKRLPVRYFGYRISVVDPGDRNTVEVHDLVRHVLVDIFDETNVLPGDIINQFVENLVAAGCYACGGVKAGKRGVSDEATRQDIWLSGVAHAMEQAGLPVKRWRKKYDLRKGESLYFRLVRELGDVFGIALPKDLKLAGQRAAQVQYGVMSPAMAAWQATELAARGRSGRW
jgi:hypothetical protein